jgi:hypothetical protein
MGKGVKTFYCGDATRTAICGCGWSCKGEAKRLQKILKLHGKSCTMITEETIKSICGGAHCFTDANILYTKGASINAMEMAKGILTKIQVAKSQLHNI